MALDSLAHYAALHHPHTHLPPDVYLLHDPHTLTIFDRFPKAKYHFLILPRIPFPVGDEDDDDEDKAIETVPRNALASLHALLTTASRATALAVLHKLQQASLEVVEMVKDEMGKTDGFEWGIEVGFHAVPSMR
ncbi:hypothetical protein QFC19_003928 [Naganishia cerealis]|uniref:Uncharacterized protein n=1 Tax=Naganishia cerealis TaxID=610337 RepID=A0ACC2W120_9TREE|nr:hypothetical protein QFC19_003928 [Naganishia cerealis]